MGHTFYLDIFGHKIFSTAASWHSRLCGSNPLLGDLLVTGGTIFFALSNVGEEFIVKKNGCLEVLAMLGLFGMFFSGCSKKARDSRLARKSSFCFQAKPSRAKSSQLVFVIEPSSSQGCLACDSTHGLARWLESWLDSVVRLCGPTRWLMLTFVGYTVAFLMYYSLTPLILQTSGSTLFNLSLLTTDMWAVVIRIFFYQQQVEWLYYVSFAVVGVGLLIYSKT
ncbi:putative solute carrier family 35 member SLC35F1/F2/F6 [Helianthus annuus]|uniref:Solute carrier family 35 member SLC35F1/F2/F6 n=1 Tax=Helianthus annuus TaxID=4232 RepID=A0A9K3HTD3_HELAN|nr:putative solute carrier family 35 member SLC35F1/F2/F6 [Helianthus annuus]KAJ0519365.1 putative solute carrier family 35 member SLC35F1/F2/F6 [Helianthus annuus]